MLVLENIAFVCSSPSLKLCPKEDIPEFAFIGRSNVGKSSLINMLTGVKGLAKVSGTPGKTRLINHFKARLTIDNAQLTIDNAQLTIDNAQLTIDNAPRPHSRLTTHHSPLPTHPIGSSEWFLVDLPGFGFAKLSKTEREKFEGMIKNYLAKRENLVCTFLLIDSRLEPQQIDLDFMNWLGDQEVSFIILFTKCDKLSKAQLAASLKRYQKKLSETWYELPLILQTSSETRTGREEVLGVIGEMLVEVKS